MPELPEVETVVRTLEAQLQQVEILNCQILYPKLCEYDFSKQIVGKKIIKYTRYGKYLMFDLNDSMWIVHLRMEGKFYVVNKDMPINKHIHAIFDLDNGLQLRYHDTRKFGRMYFYPKQKDLKDYPCMKNVGYDVFDARLNHQYLFEQFSKRKYTLKQALLDQSIMAGIGNIYSDEICFTLGLHPESRVASLNVEQCETLLDITRTILNKAILDGGTTIRSYTSSLGVDGRFQLSLKVHSKKGEKCINCEQEIIKIKVGGRGTYLCNNCQRKI